MKKLLLSLMIFTLVSIGITQAETMKIVGTSSECDTTLTGCQAVPLALSVLCSGATCPFRASYSLTDSNRLWGSSSGAVGACSTSTNGGTTWVSCTTQAFVGGTFAGAESYAGAADGSVIAVSDSTGPSTCHIRRSTDNATSWTTVFTAPQLCKPGNLEGQYLYCISNGSCTYVVMLSGVSYRYTSSDNGASWTQEINGTGNGSICGAAQWNGTDGILPACQTGATSRAWYTSSGVWTTSANWGGTQADCWGQVIYNGVPRAICQGAGATPDSRYTIRSGEGTNIQSLDLPDALLTLIDTGGVAATTGATNNLYIFAMLAAGNVGVWVTRDGSTFFRFATVTGDMRGGNAFYHNGCIYAAFGATGKKFVRIC